MYSLLLKHFISRRGRPAPGFGRPHAGREQCDGRHPEDRIKHSARDHLYEQTIDVSTQRQIVWFKKTVWAVAA